jgi:hypothetical protein
MSEQQLLTAVIKLAATLGWKTAHFSTAQSSKGRWMTAVQGDGAGFPDLVCVRGERLLFIELKAPYRKPSDKQVEWLAELAKVGEVYLWWPRDWHNGTIEAILKGERHEQ